MKKTGFIITPFDFTEEPIEFSQKEAKEYKQYVSEELLEFIDTIKFGLSFFNIKAFINDKHKNQIDIYDSNNKLLHSKRIEAPKNRTELIECLLKAQFNAKFRTNIGELSWKSEPINEGKRSENHYIHLNCNNYSKSISIYKRNGKILEIEAKIYGQKDFNIKKISVSKMQGEWVNFELDDVFGPNGNHKEGKVRRLTYDNSISNWDISAHIKEEYAHEKRMSLDSSHTSWDGKEKDRITIWENNNRKTFEVSNTKMKDYINKILSHPRSKEIISYLEEEIEREFPGMINYIKNNFDVYNKITGLTYNKGQEFEELINGLFIPECDFATEKNKKKLIKRYK